MVMVGHLLHRGFDAELPASRSHRPASLSARIIDGMLRREMAFDGVVVTDCLDMAAAAEHFSLQAIARTAWRRPSSTSQATAAVAPTLICQPSMSPSRSKTVSLRPTAA